MICLLRPSLIHNLALCSFQHTSPAYVLTGLNCICFPKIKTVLYLIKMATHLCLSLYKNNGFLKYFILNLCVPLVTHLFVLGVLAIRTFVSKVMCLLFFNLKKVSSFQFVSAHIYKQIWIGFLVYIQANMNRGFQVSFFKILLHIIHIILYLAVFTSYINNPKQYILLFPSLMKQCGRIPLYICTIYLMVTPVRDSPYVVHLILCNLSGPS